MNNLQQEYLKKRYPDYTLENHDSFVWRFIQDCNEKAKTIYDRELLQCGLQKKI